MKLTVDSTSSLLKTLQDLGCCDVSKLSERVLDISLKEVTLLQCVFSSNGNLTDTFLKNQKVRKIYRRLSPCLEKMNLLRASLVTSSAMSSAFRNLIVWKVPKEEDRWNPISKKPKTET